MPLTADRPAGYAAAPVPTEGIVMHGDVVKAAKWLGGCVVAASLVVVVGFHPAVTSRVLTVSRVQPVGEFAPQPFLNTITSVPAVNTVSSPASLDVRERVQVEFFDGPSR